MSRAKILYLVRGLSVGELMAGGERYAIELAIRLAQRGWQITLCSLWQSRDALEKEATAKLQAHGVDVLRLHPLVRKRPSPRTILHLATKLRSLLEDRGPDIVHTHSMTSDLVAVLARQALGRRARFVRLVRTVHNREFGPMLGTWRGLAISAVDSTLYPLAFAAETAVSRAYVESLDKRPLARVLGKRAVWLPNAVDSSRFSGQPPGYAHRLAGIAQDAPIVGLVGKLTVQKGPDVFLRAAAEVAKNLPDVHFVIVGDGPLREELRITAGKLGLAQRVHFLGPRGDIEPLLASFSVLVSSSRWEGMPTVILEAMAAGVPVVATDIPGTNEVVCHELTGLVTPPDDSKGMARAITRLLRDQQLRHTLASAAGRVAQSRSFDAILPTLEALYGRLLGG